ncbi:Aldo/keto reductase [Penicillium lividum]|nr:Aldo/keto reductase [Penicillium lividum]
MSPTTAIPIVLGSMTIGKAGTAHVRIDNGVAGANAMLDTFQKHEHKEIDTARVYGAGSTEEYLGEANWQGRGLLMDTKLYPSARHDLTWITPELYTLSAADTRTGFMRSLKALQAEKTGIEMFYLHGPDRSTPIEETLAEVDRLYREGHFRRFGISNFQSWEVARICEICDKNGFIKPTTYQGVYNAYQRSVEAELLPCLRHYGIGLYAFQPLAAGLLTSRYQRNQEEYEAGSRFDPKTKSNLIYHDRYLTDRNFDALELLRSLGEKYDLTEAECGLRWMMHHSALKKELGDAVLIGASSPAQLEKNLLDFEKGPLPEEIVQALDKGWKVISGTYRYWH